MARGDNRNTTAIVDYIYPLVEKSLKTRLTQYKAMLSRFISTRSEQLYAIAPYDRIYYMQADIDDFFRSLNIDIKKVKEALTKTYYWQIASYNPAAAKDELTMAALMVIRYFALNKMEKELELSMIYLAFSGKLYPSCHYGSFPTVVPREYEHIMLYVVNNLSDKYDIRSAGSVIGAVKSINNTWINTYRDDFKDKYDETYTYLLQQLHNRIKSFMKNIATEYYKAYENRDYITYDSDAIENDGENTKERLADSESLKLERYVNNALESITTGGVDQKHCVSASDGNVKTGEIKSIIESIITDPANIPTITEFLRLLVGTFMSQSKTKDIHNIEFISFSLKAKPNTHDKNIIRQKEIVEKWLDENSPAYRKRKSREATRLSYNRAVITYFTLVTYYANR